MLFLAACGGGDGSGSKDLAEGKVFEQAELQRCFREEGFAIEPRDTVSNIDFSARSRSGLITVDFGVERDSDAAKAREQEWRKLAEQAEVENIDDYYFRYGNVVIAFERVPGEQARARVERCLS